MIRVDIIVNIIVKQYSLFFTLNCGYVPTFAMIYSELGDQLCTQLNKMYIVTSHTIYSTLLYNMCMIRSHTIYSTLLYNMCMIRSHTSYNTRLYIAINQSQRDVKQYSIIKQTTNHSTPLYKLYMFVLV